MAKIKCEYVIRLFVDREFTADEQAELELAIRDYSTTDIGNPAPDINMTLDQYQEDGNG